MDTPTAAAILERAKRLANTTVFAIALQRRRLQSREPEDEVFVFRIWSDWEFLILALRRLRRTAQIASNVPAAAEAMTSAIASFDGALPCLKEMRDVIEHLEQYAVDAPNRHHLAIQMTQLEVGSFDGKVFRWLDHELDADVALDAARTLYQAIRDTHRALPQEFKHEAPITETGD